MSESKEETKDYEILEDDYAQYDLRFKIIVIGNSGVGKSCFTNKAIKNVFKENHEATIGFEFLTLNIIYKSKVIKLQIWDTCGQELYSSLISNFYRSTSLAIVVYAVNSLESFQDLEMWFTELRTYSEPDIKIVLVGNKTDLESDRVVTTEQGEEFAKANNVYKFIEASAKEGINTQSTFIDIAKILFEESSKFKNDDTNSSSKGKTKKLGKENIYESEERQNEYDENNKKKRCCG